MITTGKKFGTDIQKNDGVALLTVLGMLLVFVMLGTAYVRYMSIEVEKARYELMDTRSENLASGGIYAAIGEIQKAIVTGDSIRDAYTISLPAFRFEGKERTPYPQTITVRVMDESGRVNLNHASPQLLIALGLTKSQVAALHKSVSRKGKNPRWLVSVDELRTRDIMDGQEFNQLNKNLFTVFTAETPKKPKGFININTANTRILAAIFNIDKVEAQTLAGKRPFKSWGEVVSKIGREPSTFNISNREYDARSMPPELSLTSRCYRLVSEVAMVIQPATSSKGLHRAVEAVVLFDSQGNESIRYWNEHPTDEVYLVEIETEKDNTESSVAVTETPVTE